MNSKGQITVFIIIGLLILLVAGVLIYYSSSEGAPVSELPGISAIPEEAREVGNLLSSCINQLTVQGLTNIGDHGGYINQNELKNIPLNPTESDSLEFTPNNKVAYWSFMNAKNNCARTKTCTFGNTPPISLDKIKSDLENYVIKNFNTCKEQLKSLQEWSINELSNPKVNIVFTNNEVGVYLKYPIRVKKGNVQKDLDDFMSPVQLRFKDIYETAAKISSTATSTGFLGDLLRRLIIDYSGLEDSELPPMQELNTELGPGKFWLEMNVKKQIMNDLLVNNIPLLQVQNSANNEVYQPSEGENPDVFYLNFNRFYNLPIDINNNYEVKFVYLPNWDIFLDLDCPGGVCRPESALLKNIIPLGIQDYSFVYDVSYPVTLFIRDPFALNGKGYTFKIALEGNLRDNQVLTKETKSLDYGFTESTASDLCNPSKRTSGEITFKINDAATKQAIDDAVISYSHIENCLMGASKEGVFKSKFPRAIGGVVSVFKQGYTEEFINLDTDEDEQVIEVSLKPLKKLKAKISHYPIVKSYDNWELRTTPESPDKDEEIYVLLTKGSFVRSLALDKNNRFNGEIELEPGKYNVIIQSILAPEPPLIIPSQEKCFRTIPTQEKCVMIPERDIVFDHLENKTMAGSAEFEWSIDESELYTNNNINFYYFYQDLKNVPEQDRLISDFEALNDIENYNQVHKSLLLPELS